MKTIWKYELRAAGEQCHIVPPGAKSLSVQVQKGVPCVWMLVDPDAATDPRNTRRFFIFGTGHPIPDSEDLSFIGTFQLDDGDLVFHLFEETTGDCE